MRSGMRTPGRNGRAFEVSQPRTAISVRLADGTNLVASGFDQGCTVVTRRMRLCRAFRHDAYRQPFQIEQRSDGHSDDRYSTARREPFLSASRDPRRPPRR